MVYNNTIIIQHGNRSSAEYKQYTAHSFLVCRRRLYQSRAEMAATMVAMKMIQPRIAKTTATATPPPPPPPPPLSDTERSVGASSFMISGAEKFP